MPTTGGRADLGPLPLCTAAWIISQNNYLRRYVLGWGEAAGSTPLHYFAKNESQWLNVFDICSVRDHWPQILKWPKNWDVGRFTFSKQNGVAYNIWYGDSTGFVTTWAQFQHEQEARGYNNVNFAGSGGYYGQLGIMTLILHRIEDPNDSDALSAYNWLSTAGAPYTSDNDFRSDPTYSMAIYPKRNNSPGAVAGANPATSFAAHSSPSTLISAALLFTAAFLY